MYDDHSYYSESVKEREREKNMGKKLWRVLIDTTITNAYYVNAKTESDAIDSAYVKWDDEDKEVRYTGSALSGTRNSNFSSIEECKKESV